MANITVTHSFVNGTTADATEVNTNFTDIINGTSDGTKDFSINALTCAGAAILNGNVTLGNATGDTITPTGRLAADLDPSADNARDFGATALAYKAMYSYDFFASLGAVGTPSFSFNGDADTGMWSSAANIVNISAGGTEILEIDGTSIDATVPFNVVSASDSSFSGGGKFGIGATTIDENLHIEDSSANSDVHMKLENDASSILLGIEGSDGDKGKLMVGTNDLVEFNADTFTLQPQASSASANVLEVRSFNASYTGDVVNIESATSSSSSFNFISVIGDYDGSPTDIFYVRGDGNVGIGTASIGSQLEILNSGSQRGLQILQPTDSQYTAAFSTTSSSTGFGIIVQAGPGAGDVNDEIARFQSANGTDKMILLGNGHLGIGTTGPSYRADVRESGTGQVAQFYNTNGSGSGCLRLRLAMDDDSSVTVDYAACYQSSGAAVGSLRNNSGTFSAVDLSDRRVKTNIRDAEDDFLGIINNVPVRRFKKNFGKTQDMCGFIAQEVQPHIPLAVSKIDPNDEDEYMMLSKTELIPYLWGAIRELSAKVEALEAKAA